ncbi:RNA-directed DNA polymerase, eukaryota, reverse transcriptase zinc-binding domain protein [Tanacetum coccineum]
MKEIESMENIYVICRNEGFLDLNIHHVGGYWIWIQFPTTSACSKFQENESLKRLYSFKRAPTSNFKVDERILWIEVSGLPLCAWGSNAYKKIASSFRKFLFFEKEESTALSLGRICISTKSHQLISEIIPVDINNKIFEASVQEIGSWSTKLKYDYTDLSFNHEYKDVDHDPDVKPDLEGENKDGERDESIASPNKEFKEDIKTTNSDLSRPPGFEFMNKSSSSNSKFSTSSASHRKSDIKGVSLINELNQIIKVGTALGYDVKVAVRGKEGNFYGSKIFVINIKSTSLGMSRGRSGGILWVWDPYLFTKDSIWLKDFMHHNNGSYIFFGDMNVVRNEQERYGSSFNSIEANHFNAFIESTGLIDLPIGGRSFTWMNKAGTKLSKLDRFLLFEDVTNMLPDIRITALYRLWSDHNLIILQVEKIDFDNSWLSRDGFDDFVKSEWNMLDVNLKCHNKFHRLKAKIRQWSSIIKLENLAK